MSFLERLPIELLEKILLYSMNFNLPRSSSLLSKKLSNKHFLKEVILATFDRPWFLWYGIQTFPDIECDDDENDAELQARHEISIKRLNETDDSSRLYCVVDGLLYP